GTIQVRHLARFPIGLLFLWTIGGCGSSARSAPPPQPPPTPPALHSVGDSNVTVVVSSTPQVAEVRAVLERALARAGFRVLRAADASTPSTLTIALIGDGTGTSGSADNVSYAKQFNKVDATVSVDGRLRNEMRTQVSYSVVAGEKETFEAFTRRTAETASRG